MFRRSWQRLAAFKGDAYALLGATRQQELPAIKKSFLMKAKTMHPDMNPNLDDAGKKKMAEDFAEMVLAWKWIETNHGKEPEPTAEPGAPAAAAKPKVFVKTRKTSHHAQDARPVVPGGRDYGAKKDSTPKVNKAAAAQAREFILTKNRTMVKDEDVLKNRFTAPPTFQAANLGRAPTRRAVPGGGGPPLRPKAGAAAGGGVPQPPQPPRASKHAAFVQEAMASSGVQDEALQDELRKIMEEARHA